MARVHVHLRPDVGRWVTHRQLGGRCLVVDRRDDLGLVTVAWRTVASVSLTQSKVTTAEVEYPGRDLSYCD